MQSSGAGSVNSLLLSISNPKLRLRHKQEGKFHEELLKRNPFQPVQKNSSYTYSNHAIPRRDWRGMIGPKVCVYITNLAFL